MTQDPDLERFASALREWADEAMAYLSGLPDGGMQAIWRAEEWQLDSDDVYRRRNALKTSVNYGYIDPLLQLDSYRQLEEAANASPCISSHLDTVVGSAF